MPFLDHLEELRWRLIWSFTAVGVGSVIGFALLRYFNALELLTRPIRAARDDPDFQLIYLSPADPFFITLKLAILVGLILAVPVVVYHVWSFFSPALEKHEKRAIVPAMYLGTVLFAAGVAMAYFIALPVSLEFFKLFEGESMREQLEIRETLGFVIKMLVAFGAIFELPVVVMVLTAIGLVTPKFLRSKRRHAAVFMTVLASMITPGDVITLTVLMLLPLLFLYELSIVLSSGIYKRKMQREGEPLEPSILPPDGSVGVD